MKLRNLFSIAGNNNGKPKVGDIKDAMGTYKDGFEFIEEALDNCEGITSENASEKSYFVEASMVGFKEQIEDLSYDLIIYEDVADELRRTAEEVRDCASTPDRFQLETSGGTIIPKLKELKSRMDSEILEQIAEWARMPRVEKLKRKFM